MAVDDWPRGTLPPVAVPALEGISMRRLFTFLALAAGIAVGVLAIVLGEGDDSPGLQGLGVLVVLGMITLDVRTTRRKSHSSPRSSSGLEGPPAQP